MCVYVHVYVRVCIHMYACEVVEAVDDLSSCGGTYVCVCVHTYIYMCMYVCVCIHMYVYVGEVIEAVGDVSPYVCVCMYVCVYTYVCGRSDRGC